MLRLATDAGLRDLPDVRVARARHRPRLAARPHGGVHDVPGRAARSCSHAASSTCSTRTATRRSTAPSIASGSVSDKVAFQMTSMLRDVVDHGTGSQRARAGRDRGRSAARPGRRTTIATRGSSASRVRSSSASGSDSTQPEPIGTDAYAARVALPIWADFMKRTATRFPARPFNIPAGLTPEELCRVSHLRPVDGCPVYTEVLQGRRRRAVAALRRSRWQLQAGGDARVPACRPVARKPHRRDLRASLTRALRRLRIDPPRPHRDRIRSRGWIPSCNSRPASAPAGPAWRLCCRHPTRRGSSNIDGNMRRRSLTISTEPSCTGDI